MGSAARLADRSQARLGSVSSAATAGFVDRMDLCRASSWVFTLGPAPACRDSGVPIIRGPVLHAGQGSGFVPSGQQGCLERGGCPQAKCQEGVCFCLFLQKAKHFLPIENNFTGVRQDAVTPLPAQSAESAHLSASATVNQGFHSDFLPCLSSVPRELLKVLVSLSRRFVWEPCAQFFFNKCLN